MRLRDWLVRCASCPAALAGLAALAANAAVAALPVKAELVVAGAANAVDIVNAGDGSARLFVVEQAGRSSSCAAVRCWPRPSSTSGRWSRSAASSGLLGLAFHPQYATNGKFFVNYTRAGDGATVDRVVSRERRRSRIVADPASRSELLTVAQPYANHNGGAVRFGPDGYLYIGMGDGGSANDPDNRAQNTHELLGKMLRIDVDAATPYAIPAANPFAAGGGRPEIFATGLRNPWRFSFDRVTGDLYIGDVGQGAIEEIDFLPRGQGAGANFGWRVMEGNQCTNLGGGPPCNAAAFTPPVLTYDHTQGCSVTGGVVYRGRRIPVLYGRYVYSDYCSGHLWAAARDRNGAWQTEVILETAHHVATIRRGPRWRDPLVGPERRGHLPPGRRSRGTDRHRIFQCDARPLFPHGLPGGGRRAGRRRLRRRLAAHWLRLCRRKRHRRGCRPCVPLLRQAWHRPEFALLHRIPAGVRWLEGQSAVDFRGHRFSHARRCQRRLPADHAARLPAVQQPGHAGPGESSLHRRRGHVQYDARRGLDRRRRGILREVTQTPPFAAIPPI